MQMKIVLIPNWVEDALKAANKPISTALSVQDLINTISIEDVAIYIDLNDRLLAKIYTPIAETFGYYHIDFVSIADKELSDRINKKIYDIRAEYPEPSITMLVSTFGSVDESGNPTGQFANQYSFEVFAIKEDVLGLRPVLRKPDEMDIQEDIRAYDNLLRLMKTYNTIEEVASTPVFNQYVRLLRAA